MSSDEITYTENGNNITTTGAVIVDDHTDPMKQNIAVPIIVGVLVAVLLITAVILFIICYRRRQQKRNLASAKATSGVYAETTAPLDDESKVMLKTGNGTEIEQNETKEPLPDTDVTVVNESSPLKEQPPSAVGADPNESQATLVNNDGNSVA